MTILIVYRKLKKKNKISFLILFSLLFLACLKKEESKIERKNNYTVILDSLNVSNRKEAVKEKILDTLSQYILTKYNDSISRNLLFKVANKYYFLNKGEKYLKLSYRRYCPYCKIIILFRGLLQFKITI
jgi:hypothetical protein